MSVQTQGELEEFYTQEDPWAYENNPADKNRRGILLGELSKFTKPKRVLDIGCGHGFITRDISGDEVVGVDISEKAIQQANKVSKKPHVRYVAADMFDLNPNNANLGGTFDLIIITGVLYPQYVGKAHTVVYDIVDRLLAKNGLVVSVHIMNWYDSRLPYIMLKNLTYEYREYQHILEIYKKI